MNVSQADSPPVIQSVSVRAPARLHLGFLDLNASIGRKFGSIGLAVNSHDSHLQICADKRFSITGSEISGECRQRIEKICQTFYQTLGQHVSAESRQLKILAHRLIPEHAGLGSGTQLALTLGTALARYHQIEVDTPTLAKALGRGRRSGIGVATFDRGGFVVDGGLKPNETVPPILMQQPYPEDWRIVLVMDPAHQGVHGQTEKHAFQTLPVFPRHNAEAICHLTLMQLLPALAEQDINAFGSAVTEIQALIGDHFAAAQGGRYTSPVVAACLEQAQRWGHQGIAQSSWGPTGCIFVDSDVAAEALIKQLEDFSLAHLNTPVRPEFIKAHSDNQGAIIETVR